MTNREIKFRAWDTVVKVIRDWKEITDVTEPIGHFFYRHDYEVMQYTGLKDKNGKEIYEGDIVKGYCYDDDLCVIEPLVGKSSFWHWFGEMGHDGSDLEVVGNIYQSPELLK